METIIVPTDFSQPADNAVNYAVELSGLFDAKLILVHASPMPAYNYDNIIPIEMLNELKQHSLRDLEKLKNELLAKPHRKLTIECYAEMGNTFDVIKDSVEKFNADMVVMGITGAAGKIKEHLIGSVAVSAARYLKIPVFIIPEKVKYQRIRKISFACDMEKTEESSLVYALKYFSKVFDAELEIVHVENPYEEVTEEKAKSSVFIEKKLETIKHKTTFISNTKVAPALQDYFRLHPSDVIMLNPKKHSIFHNLFSESITNELAFHLPLPMLAIH
jgi:nucleotide-binding universal stress UspA family protein